ncbi:hypothetical protein SAMN04487843_10622 [Methylobacterium sp. ap11]|uniref:hypothetical protein n=1 Tax=Methylobacterium sp. ap11 TaxID=1761799 RepID=UPI0008C01F32|nr:hypothetical protein [Methylobacterium sp. ap11]SEP03397.1 hypothetical protein SAMN04487843_10622 [Methylobacterium sp. ap11]
MPYHDDTRASIPLRALHLPAVSRAPADRMAEHLIEAYRHAVACEDQVVLDLLRLALGYVGRTYPPTALHAAEEPWS